jgi:hypothetical protein
MLGNSWVAAQLAASQEGLSSMEPVNYELYGNGAHNSETFIISELWKNPAIFTAALKEIGDYLQTASSANCQQFPTDV